MAKILVVEDNPLNLRLLREVLEHRGHAVDAATSVKEASERLGSSRPDLLLVDIQIPGGGGERLLREVRGDPSHAGLPVIAVTAKAMKGDREKCIEAGAWDYLSKPVDPDQMLAVLRAWLCR